MRERGGARAGFLFNQSFSKTFGLGERIVGIGLLALASLAFSEPKIHRVLIIDQGVDFTASALLKAKRETNFLELSGRDGFDDDNNSFIDDLSGWNLVSNTPDFFPEWIQDFFRLRKNEIQFLSQQVLGRLAGDPNSAQYFRRPEFRKLHAEVMEWGHGTHVAGIVAQYSSDKTRILSANMQSPSHAGNVLSTSNFLSAGPLGDFQQSIYDSKEATVEVLKDLTRNFYKQAQVLDRYLQATKPGVANLSFGSISKDEIRQQAEEIWMRFLRQNSLKITQPRNEAQELNFQFFVNNLYRYEDERWTRLFNRNPETLFVIAAGNRSSNLESQGALPATLSATVPNVMTVIAIDNQGSLASFSNYSQRYTNVAAWGVDVVSALPGGENLAMNGTSMAAPFVSALASRIRIANPNLTAPETKSIIERSVTRLPAFQALCTSGGVINFDSALELAKRGPRTMFELAIE
jgi:subtilisin family serine protease